MPAPPNHNEQARLASLRSYNILDTVEEEDFDDVTALAAAIFEVPIASITLVDEDRQWSKSHFGFTNREDPRNYSLCAHAITVPDEVMIVEDAKKDERFAGNPLVFESPNIGFYAGAPLVNDEGFALGTLCIIDHSPRTLSREKALFLKVLAGQVVDKLALRKKILELDTANRQLASTVEELASTVEKLKTTTEELASTNTKYQDSEVNLNQLNNELEEIIAARTNELSVSEAKFRGLIEQSPIAMQVFRGDDMVHEIVNETMLQFLGKTPDILGKPLFTGIPEIVGQPIVELLYSVYHTGKPLELKAVPVMLQRNGRLENGFYNVSYRALYDDGKITGVLGIAIDVTEQLTSQKQLEEAQDRLTLALEGAQLGIWNANAATDKLTLSDRARQIHGLAADTVITLAEFVNMITGEYRELVLKKIREALNNKTRFDVQYPINPQDGSPQRWLRSNGQAYYNEQGAPLYIMGTMLDITEQRRDDQRKNDFIGMVSHELKTPLTSLSAYVQLLQAKAKKGEDYFTLNALDKATKQVKKMTGMINGFLNVSRLESGKIHIDKQEFDMAELVKEVEEESIATITSHKVIFAPVEKTLVIADREKIGQVINNFISNAVKYSPPGTTIQVACENIDNSARVCVSDEGVGIEPEDQKKLFERYYRVEGSHTQTISGFGIGLYLSAEIIQHHNGQIWVVSRPGKGSTFYFSLPL